MPGHSCLVRDLQISHPVILVWVSLKVTLPNACNKLTTVSTQQKRGDAMVVQTHGQAKSILKQYTAPTA